MNECEGTHDGIMPKSVKEEVETDIRINANIKSIPNLVCKRATRSRRPTKPKKEFDLSPSSRKPKEEKQDGLSDNNITKKRILWGFPDKSLFFDALLEHGKDFDAIQNFMTQKQKRRGDVECVKSKDQIRHFYYRTWHKISPFIKQSSADETKKQNVELQTVLCYGEMRKKIVAKFDEKLGQKLNELVHKGITMLRLKGKKVVLKAPSYKARKLHHQHTSELPNQAKPEKVSIELVPRNNRSWGFVQSLSQNPRIMILMRLDHTVANLIDFLQNKWSQQKCLLEVESRMRLRIHIPPNARFNEPLCVLQYSSPKITRNKNDTLPPDIVGCKPMPAECNETVLNDKHKQVTHGYSDDDDDDDDEANIEKNCEIHGAAHVTGDKKSKPDDVNEEREILKYDELDEIHTKLLNEGLDENTGCHVTFAKLLMLHSYPEIIKLEYSWIEASVCSKSVVTNCLMDYTPFLNSRLQRLMEVACTEYSAFSDQKSKEFRAEETKISSNSAVVNGNDVFRSPESAPPKTPHLKITEKRIVDHDLLQQMPIFQKKSEIFLSRRHRKKVVQKAIPTNFQRPLVPKLEILPRSNLFFLQQKVGSSVQCVFSSPQSGLMTPSLIRFSTLNSNMTADSLISSSLTSSLPLSFTSSSTSSLTSVTSTKLFNPPLITMEPSELKPSVRRIVPITLNKTSNMATMKNPYTTLSHTTSVSKVITGNDVFFANEYFEDTDDISANSRVMDNSVSHANSVNDVAKTNAPATFHKQAAVDDSLIQNEELSLNSFWQDAPSNPTVGSTGVSLLHHFFLSDSSRDSNFISKFDVDTTLQCLMNESSLDFASRFADIAAQLSSSSTAAGTFQTPPPSSPPSLLTFTPMPPSTQSSLVSSKLT